MLNLVKSKYYICLAFLIRTFSLGSHKCFFIGLISHTEPALDKDIDMGTISPQQTEMPLMIQCHVTPSVLNQPGNWPEGQFANDVHLMLCHH